MRRETHTLAIAHRQYATICRNMQSLIVLFTTFGWLLFHNDWIPQPSTHANVEMQKAQPVRAGP